MADLLTWASDLDNVTSDISSAAVIGKQMCFEFHKAILGTGAWSCIKSCAYVGGSQQVANANLFSNTFVASEWVHGSTVRSWALYYCAGLDHYMVLDLFDWNYNSAGIWFAKTAFTGGTISARPTSIDEWGYSAGSGADDAGSQIRWFDGSLTVQKMNLVFATRGDFWFWTYKSGLSVEWFAIVFTKLTDLDSVVGDNYPCVSYSAYNSGSNLGALGRNCLFGGGGVTNGRRGWKGRTGGGVLANSDSLRFCLNMHRYEENGWDPYSLLANWSNGGGQWRHKYLSHAAEVYVWDTNAVYTDYKGLLPDVELAPRLSTGAPNGTPPTRRNIGHFWMPGMPVVGPQG